MEYNFDWLPNVEEYDEAPTPRTRKRNTKKKKKKRFVGWATMELIEFLDSIGKDTTKALSHYDVTNIVTQYIADNKLIHPEKKKRVMCDGRLQALFGGKKQSVMRTKIHDLLEPHLLENHVASDDDPSSSDEKEEDLSVMAKKQKLSSDKVAPPKKKAAEVLKRALAAICPENIKLAYLRRSLVKVLLDDLETFESKVVGSFVRIKSDPYDIFQKNSHQLQLVTGVKADASAGNGHPKLRLSGATNDISISELSDDKFSEEECEDLCKRAKDGLLKQPTVGELEQKVAILHELITNDWLARELARLKILFDHANEKGPRYKATEYLERRLLLEKPEEKSRLLNEIPDVIPEKVKPEIVSVDPPVGLDESLDDSPKVAEWDLEPYRQDSQAPFELGTRNNGEAQLLSLGEGAEPVKVQVRSESNADEFPEPAERNNSATEGPRTECNGHTEILNLGAIDIPDSEEVAIECNGHQLPSSNGGSAPPAPEDLNKRKDVEVITLSDDEDEEQETLCQTKHNQLLDPEKLAWYYFDPQDRIQGPFSLTSLKKWSDLDYFPASFRVWMIGQSPQEATLLSHILQQIYPG